MDIHANPSQPADDRAGAAGGPEDPGVEPRPSTVVLARTIGARLRAPFGPGARERLAHTLAEASTAARADAGHGPARTTVATGARADDARPSDSRPVGPLASGRRTRRSGPARTRLGALAAALVVVTAGVVSVVRSGDELPVIVLAGGGLASGGMEASAMASGPEGARVADAASSMIGLWVPTIHRFVLAEGVSLSVGRAPAWRLVPPADLDRAAAGLAAAFGLPAPAPTEWDPAARSVQDTDGANLWVSAAGDWYYGGPSDLWPVWDCSPSRSSTEGPDAVPDASPYGGQDAGVDAAPTVEECAPPAPPVGVPSEARARTLAAELLARLGHRDVVLTSAQADEWGAWVQGEVVLPGAPTGSGMYVGVGFAGGEQVAWANGTLAGVELLGDYPLIDVPAALVRLEREMNAWLEEGQGGGPVARPLPADMSGDVGGDVGADGPAVAPGEAPSDRSVEGGAVEGGAGVDTPVTILPVPEPLPGRPGEGGTEPSEPVERLVRIVAVELVTLPVWTAGERTVLLPHLRLVDEDGGWWFVAAVEDRYLVR